MAQTTIKPQEIREYQNLYDDISNILKRKECKHLQERSYAALAETTESQHFKKYYSPQKLQHLVQTQGKEGLLAELKRNYFYTLPYETKRSAELNKEQQKLRAEQQAEQQKTRWQKMSLQKERAARIASNQEYLQSTEKNIQEQTQKLQAINMSITTHIEDID